MQKGGVSGHPYFLPRLHLGESGQILCCSHTQKSTQNQVTSDDDDSAGLDLAPRRGCGGQK